LGSYKLGIIGCGNMGEAILKGILDSGFLKSNEIIFYDNDNYRSRYIKNNYKILSESDLEIFPFDMVLDKPSVPNRYILGKVV